MQIFSVFFFSFCEPNAWMNDAYAAKQKYLKEQDKEARNRNESSCIETIIFHTQKKPMNWCASTHILHTHIYSKCISRIGFISFIDMIDRKNLNNIQMTKIQSNRIEEFRSMTGESNQKPKWTEWNICKKN